MDDEATVIIPPSANWYLPHISSTSNDNMFFGYGANSVIVLFTLKNKGRMKINILTGHTSNVNSITFLEFKKNVNWIVSSSQDGSVRVWDCTTFKCIAVQRKHQQYPFCAVVSPVNSNLVFSSDENGFIIAWRLPVQNMNSEECCSNQGNFVSLDCSKFNIKAKVSIIQCHPTNEEEIIIGFHTGVIIVVNWLNGEIIHRLLGHIDFICSFTFCNFKKDENNSNIMSDDTSIILMASGSKDKTVRIWNIVSGQRLQTINLPESTSIGKGNRKSDSRQRFWLSLAWNPKNSMEIICSSHSGDIFSINLSHSDDSIKSLELLSEDDLSQKLKCKTLRFGTGKKGLQHSRAVFSINFINDNQFFTCSMDRQIGKWDVSSRKPIQMIHCPGGHVYSIHTNPLHPSSLSIGVGDQSILLWKPPKIKDNLPSGDCYDIKFFWRGLQSKVTSLQWHPIKEGILGFGTDDGRIGIYDTNSSKHKLFSSSHKGIVFNVQWRLYSNTQALLYSTSSDGSLLISNENSMKMKSKDWKDFVDNDSLSSIPNGMKINCISFHKNNYLVAIGLNNGTILYFKSNLHSSSDNKKWMEEKFTIYKIDTTHSTEIRSLQFHPGSLVDSEIPYENWIASGSKSGTILISDSTNLNDMKTWKLIGHCNCVTDLQWSPHNPNQLISSSYDGTIQLWDARPSISKPLSNFRGHTGRVLSCCFSLLHNNILFSSSEDHTCRMWNIDKITHTNPPSANEVDKLTNFMKKKKNKRRKTKKNSDVHTSISIQESIPKQNVIPTLVTSKTLFPSLDVSQQTKTIGYSQCIELAKQIYSTDSPITSNEDIIQNEINQLSKSNTNQLNSVALEMWLGNTLSTFNSIFTTNTSTEQQSIQQLLLPLTPLGGFNIWKQFIIQQAKIYQEKGEYHIAVMYFLAAREIIQAIEVYQKAELYNDAIILTKIQLGINHPKISELYKLQASFFEKQGKYEQASKSYLNLKEPKEAIRCLEKKNELDSLTAALEIIRICNLKEEYSQLYEKVGMFLLNSKETHQAAKLYSEYGEELRFHLFPCGIEYTLSQNNSEVLFASSRVQSSQLKSNKGHELFITLFPTFKYQESNLFFDNLWNFFGVYNFLIDSNNIIEKLQNIKQSLWDYIQKEQLELSSNVNISLYFYSLAIINRLLSNDTENIIELWLKSIHLEIEDGSTERGKLYLQNIDITYSLDIPQDCSGNINAFKQYFELFSNLKNKIPMEEESILNFEKVLLPSSLVQLDELKKKLDDTKERLQIHLQRESLLDLSKKQSGKKRLREVEEIMKDDIIEDSKEELESQIQYLVSEIDSLKQSISKLPFPCLFKSKKLLLQAKESLLIKNE